ncbi:MAG: hypothetical protein LBV00_11340 [Propionibacteriaceae bacterium]|jgi:tetratricopeptide (TPR) repeat protein|nr:hypothetical protein [Propionibacteriaceae bacterium]
MPMARSVPEATIAVGRIRAMPFGRSRVEEAARQVRLIDAEGPDEVKAYALESLVEALTWSGQPGKAVAPFIKLLRWWDRRPDLFDRGDQNILFWEFGWIVSDLARTASVPVSQVDRTLDDMERRFSLASRGMERVWAARLEWELLRHGPGLDEVFTTWLTMPVDDEDSCLACHEERHADYLLEVGDIDGAIVTIEAALTAELECSREPASMLAMLAWSYVERGRLDDADRVLPQALSHLRQATSLSLMVAYARLFEVFARGGNPDRAVELLPRLREGLTIATDYVRLQTWRHLLAGGLSLRAHGLGGHPIAGGPVDQSTIDELVSHLQREAVTMSQAFDLRHGSSVQAERLARAQATSPTARPLVAARADETAPPVNHRAPSTNRATPPKAGSRVRATARDSLRAKADQAFSDGRHAAAVDLYKRAAEQAQTDGRLLDAGWCWAEAARNEQESGDRNQAGRDYIQAQARLRAAGVSIEEIAPMFVAWAPAVGHQDYAAFVKLALQDYPSPAHPDGQEAIEELPAPVRNHLLGSPLVRRYLLSQAALRDAVARVMATWGDRSDTESAVAMAEESASRFSSLGRTEAASHAWWLAARLAAQLDRDSVNGDYAMAIQGFVSTGERNHAFGRKASQEYAAFLRARGESERADEILNAWKTREVD